MLLFATSNSSWLAHPFVHYGLFIFRTILASVFHVDSRAFNLTNRLSPTTPKVSFRNGYDGFPRFSFCPLLTLFKPTFSLNSLYLSATHSAGFFSLFYSPIRSANDGDLQTLSTVVHSALKPLKVMLHYLTTPVPSPI